MISKLLARWRFRKHPKDDYRADYETLIRLARRCAYDLRHTIDQLPLDHFYIEEMGMRNRSNWWVAQFSKGNPGKDYRHEMQRDIDHLRYELNKLHDWCAERGLSPPDGRDIPF